MHKRSGLKRKDIALAAGKHQKDKAALRVDHLEERSTRDVRAALAKVGFGFVRKHKYKVELYRQRPSCELSIPDRVNLSRGELHRVALKAGLAIEELKDLLVAVDRDRMRKRHVKPK